MAKKLPILIYGRWENIGDEKTPDYNLITVEKPTDLISEVGESYSVGVYKLVEVQRLENKTTLLKN